MEKEKRMELLKLFVNDMNELWDDDDCTGVRMYIKEKMDDFSDKENIALILVAAKWKIVWNKMVEDPKYEYHVNRYTCAACVGMDCGYWGCDVQNGVDCIIEEECEALLDSFFAFFSYEENLRAVWVFVRDVLKRLEFDEEEFYEFMRS